MRELFEDYKRADDKNKQRGALTRQRDDGVWVCINCGFVFGAHADDERLLVGPDRAHRLEDLEEVAHPVLQRAAVFVGAPVGHRRQEAREEVAVGGVELEEIEAGARGVLRRHDELPLHPLEVLLRHLPGDGPALVEGDGRGRQGLPGFLGRQRPVALPRAAAAPLPSRVADLDSDLRR